MVKTSVVKEIVGGGSVTAEVKFGPAVSFRSTVRLIFATNTLPRTEDISEGWFGRVKIVEFPNKFKANPGFQLRFDQWVRERRDWLLLWAVEGLRRYKMRGKFTVSKAMDAIMGEYRSRADTVAWFVDEVLEESLERGSFIPMDVMWELFKEVCDDARRRACSRPEFVRRLGELGFKVGPGVCEVEGVRKNVRCCLGVKVSEEYEEEYEDIMYDLKIERAARRTRKRRV